MKKYKLIRPTLGVPSGAIFEETSRGYKHSMHNNSYIGFPKELIESNPNWFEEIKEPKSYWYINDRLEIICELWPETDFEDGIRPGKIIEVEDIEEYNTKRISDYWKWKRIKAGNCFKSEAIADSVVAWTSNFYKARSRDEK